MSFIPSRRALRGGLPLLVLAWGCTHAHAQTNTTQSPKLKKNAADAHPAPIIKGPASPAPVISHVSSPPNKTEDVLVVGHHFLDADTSGITNLPLPVQKVPQSISLVNANFVRTANLHTMGEVAQYTPGALWASYSPSYGNQIWLRGFAANYAIDGLLVGDQITEPDSAILERYEIVKGPASVVYGAQSPGGVVNLVSKRATADTPSYVQALGGSWGRWRLEGQAAGALNASGTIRAIGVVAQEEGGGFVDHVGLEKTVVYGGLDFDIARNLTGYVRASYQRTENTPYNGIPTYADGVLPRLPRSFFLGGSNITNTTHAIRTEAGLNWRPSDLWSVDLKAVYQNTIHDGGNVYSSSYIGYDGSFALTGEHFNDWHTHDLTIAGTATRRLDDLGLKNSYIVGSLRYQHYRYYIDETSLTGGTVNIFDGDEAVSNAFNTQLSNGSVYQQNQDMNYLTASLQGVFQVVKHVTLIGGFSYSRPWINYQTYFGPWQNLSPGGQFDGRAAIVYEPVRGLNFYASYGQSYQPNLRIDTSYHVLQPIQGEQYEVGAKYMTPNQRLLLTAALFQIKEDNVAQYNVTVAGEALYRAENVRHRGMELEATGQLTRHWQVRAGVALLDPVIMKDPANPVNNGETRPWLPKVTANLYTTYDFRNGISIGGGMRYMGAVKTYDRSLGEVTPNLPSYVVFDASIGYTLDKWRFQANLKNIGDRRYYVVTPVFASLSAGLYPGAPRSFTLSARRDF